MLAKAMAKSRQRRLVITVEEAKKLETTST